MIKPNLLYNIQEVYKSTFNHSENNYITLPIITLLLLGNFANRAWNKQWIPYLIFFGDRDIHLYSKPNLIAFKIKIFLISLFLNNYNVHDYSYFGTILGTVSLCSFLALSPVYRVRTTYNATSNITHPSNSSHFLAKCRIWNFLAWYNLLYKKYVIMLL